MRNGGQNYDDEKYIDYDSTDDEIEKFVERGRKDFYEEWFRYISEYE